MGQPVRMDLHVHTALSPCAAEEMKPPAVLLTAENRGVAILGIVDHCTARNGWAFLEASRAFDVRVLVGLEVGSAEGVHIVTLFADPDAAMDMDSEVASHLPNRANRPDITGEQHLLDEWGHVLAEDPRMLILGTDLRLSEIARMADERDGLAFPAHVERNSGGLLPTLGLVPRDLQVPLFEVSRFSPSTMVREAWPQLAATPLIRSSDAHVLDEIGAAMTWVPPGLAEDRITARQFGQRVAEWVTASREVEP